MRDLRPPRDLPGRGSRAAGSLKLFRDFPLPVRLVHVLTGVGAVGVLLPWIVAPGVSSDGLDHRDGRLILLLAGAILLLSQTRARWVWTLSGFATAIALRTLLRVLEQPELTAGIGLWVTVAGFGGATIVMLRDLLGGIRGEEDERHPP